MIDQAIRERIQAVVVDANAYGGVGPDLARLSALAVDLAKINIQTWLPEPVVWEWAEHLASEWAGARNLARRSLGYLARSGLTAMRLEEGYKNREDVVEKILQVLADLPSVEIIELTGDGAVKGLKDQILQSPPAKTKGESKVKTGASDSAWLRDVLARVDSPQALLFLSSDRDIVSAYREWDLGEPLMRTPDTIRSALFEDIPASIHDQWLIVRYLTNRVPVGLDMKGDSDKDRLIGDTVGLLDALDADWEEHGWTGGHLTKLTALAGLREALREAPEAYEPGKIPRDRAVRASAYFLAEAEITHVYSFGDQDALREETTPASGVVAWTRLVFHLRDDTVVRVDADSDTTVFTAGRFGDNWDAMEEIDDVLSCVPGLQLPPEWGGWPEAEQTFTVDSTEHTVDVWGEPGDFGTVAVRIGDDEARIICYHDNESWMGGKDGMYMEPPYYLGFEASDFPQTGSGAFELSAWLIQKLVARSSKPNQ